LTGELEENSSPVSLQVFTIDSKKHILNAGVNNSIWESNDSRDETEDSGLLGKLTEE
jgi:hypothetical protein